MRHQHKKPPVPLRSVKTLRKGQVERRIIGKVTHKGREYSLHATKGYRTKRA